MKKLLIQKKGITLLALVITIIVLLILAGVSITMISGNNSLINQAIRAKELTEEKQIDNNIKIAYLAAMTTGSGEVDKSKLEYELDKLFNEYVLSPDLTKVKVNGKIYYFNDLISTPSGEWTQNSEGKIVSSDGMIELQIGDYVDYSPANSQITYITSDEDDNGYGDQTFRISDYSGSWRILGVKDGKIELISENSVTRTNFILEGRIAYENAITELNKVASLFGHGEHAVEARSVTVEDINKITGYNPKAIGIRNPTEEQIASGTRYRSGYLNEYENIVTYSWDGTNKPYYTATNGLSGNLDFEHNVSNYGSAFYWFEDDEWEKSKYTTTPKRITTITSTSYKYKPESLGFESNSLVKEMLFSQYYWLASRCVELETDCVCYDLFSLWYGEITSSPLAYSDGDKQDNSNGVRPVVILSADTQFVSNGDNSWKLK